MNVIDVLKYMDGSHRSTAASPEEPVNMSFTFGTLLLRRFYQRRRWAEKELKKGTPWLAVVATGVFVAPRHWPALACVPAMGTHPGGGYANRERMRGYGRW